MEKGYVRLLEPVHPFLLILHGSHLERFSGLDVKR
jgi:hypothetical protein